MLDLDFDRARRRRASFIATSADLKTHCQTKGRFSISNSVKDRLEGTLKAEPNWGTAKPAAEISCSFFTKLG